MSEELIVQFLGTVFTGAVAYYAAKRNGDISREELEASKAESEKKHDENIKLIDYRLKELEKKMDKHNNIVERLTIVETALRLKEK